MKVNRNEIDKELMKIIEDDLPHDFTDKIDWLAKSVRVLALAQLDTRKNQKWMIILLWLILSLTVGLKFI